MYKYDMKKQHATPLISCISCHKEYSTKGIFSHFFATHDPVGNKIMNAIRKKGTDRSFRNPDFRGQYKKPNAIIAHKCFNPECENMTKNKFCSCRCSAIVCNKNRTKEVYEKQARTLLETKRKNGWSPKENITVPIPRKRRTCSVCGKIEETNGRFQSETCSYCNDSLTYRNSCGFTFNLKIYPEEFDLALLTEHGMFNPKTNQGGVSKDHMVSVGYGKKNQIDPKIMSHPANCRLMLHHDNAKKQSNSSLTYEELLIRIAEWDAKYPKQGQDSNLR